jgi:hypothetical protein
VSGWSSYLELHYDANASFLLHLTQRLYLPFGALPNHSHLNTRLRNILFGPTGSFHFYSNTNMKRIRLRPTRTRTGCQTCRERRKGCDNARPTCGACKRLNLKCSFDVPLKWAATRKPFVEQNERLMLQHNSYDFSSLASDPSTHVQLRQVLQRIGASQDLQRTVLVKLCSVDQEILLGCR